MQPRPSAGTRSPSTRSTASFRSILVNPLNNRVVRTESHLESKHALTFMMRPDVLDVIEQHPRVEFIDHLGKLRFFTADICVTFTNGRRVAYSVKPLEKALKSGLRETIGLIARQVPTSVVDAFAILTEADVEPWQYSNAVLLYSAARRGDLDAEAAEAVLAVAHAPISIGDIVGRTGMAGRAFRAIIALLAQAQLVLITKGRLTYASIVAPNASPIGEIA